MPATKLIFFFFSHHGQTQSIILPCYPYLIRVEVKSMEGYRQQCPGGSQQFSMTALRLQAQFANVAVL